MPNRYRGGVIPRETSFPVIESDLSRTLTSAEKLGETISQIFQTRDEYKRRQLAQILEGVKSGIVDPNEALVQGTPGGGLFERYFGAKPPEAPRTEITRGQKEVPFEVTGPPSEEPEPYTGSFLEPTTTEKRVGGFQPRTTEQLKQYLIQEELAGRKPDPRLYVLGGLTKTAAQQAVIDPEFAKKMAVIRNNPALLRAFVDMQKLYQDEPPSSIMDMILGAQGAITGEKKPKEIVAPKTLSFAKQKLLAIGQYKNASLGEQARHNREAEKLGQERLTLDKARETNRVYGNIFSVVSRHVDPDLAKQITDAYVEGTNIEDMPLGEELKKRVANEIGRKDTLTQARAEAMKTLGESRKAHLELDQQKFQSGIDRFNALMQLNVAKLASVEAKQFQANLLKTIVERLKDPNTRQQGEQMLTDFMIEHLGGEIGDYSVFQGIKEGAGRIFGFKGLGTPEIKIPIGPPAKAPFNPPTLKAPPRGGKPPQTYKELKEKWQGGQ